MWFYFTCQTFCFYMLQQHFVICVRSQPQGKQLMVKHKHVWQTLFIRFSDHSNANHENGRSWYRWPTTKPSDYITSANGRTTDSSTYTSHQGGIQCDYVKLYSPPLSSLRLIQLGTQLHTPYRAVSLSV